MAETRIAPYTLTDFASIPEHTIFVIAYEYGHVQDELPLGLDWTQAYRKLATSGHGDEFFHRINRGSLYSYAEMVKYRKGGLFLNGRGSSNCDPDIAVITGPSIALLPKFGGPLEAPVLEVLRLIFAQPLKRFPRVKLLPNQDFHRIETITASSTLGGWLNILAARHLIDLDGTNVELTNLGVLRAIQESETNVR